MIKCPVVCSKNLGELLGKIKASDPMSGSRIHQAKVNYEEMYFVSSDNLKKVPLMPGDMVTFHSEMGGGRLGFASDN
jgi:hypothetical protein